MPRDSHADKRLVERELRFDKGYWMKVKGAEALEDKRIRSCLLATPSQF